MMHTNLQKLREKRNEKVAQMESIISASEGDTLSEEDSKAFDALEAEVSNLNSAIERVEKLNEHQSRLEESTPSVGRRQVTTVGPAPGPEAAREFEHLGEFIHSVRFNPNDQRLEWHDSVAPRGEQRMDGGAQGGFAIPQQFRSSLMELPSAGAVVRPRATVIPAGSPPDAGITMPALDQGAAQNMYGGVVVNWIGEGGAKPETDYRIKEISLLPKEVAGHVVLTDKLLRNWQAAGPLTERLLRSAITAAEDDKFISGLGAGVPEGFLNSAAALAVNRAGAGAIAYDDLLDMDAAFFARGGQTPVWITNKKRSKQLRNLVSPDNQLIWQESAREGEPANLLGYPVVYTPRGIPSTLGNKGDIVLADLSYYLIKDGSGPFVAASEHVHFTSNKTVIKIFWNVDGAMWLNEAITDEDGQTYSPVVILDVP